MQHAENVAIIHQTGGGTGMTYEFLRPAGSMVNSTRGVASGPVSFMNIVNQTTEVVKQGGVRRGANMGILSVVHPDILRFIHAKNDQHSLTNFNISVTVTDDFMKAVDDKVWFQTEFDGEPWNQTVFDAVTGKDYVVYRRPDGSTATFADKLAFENADLSDCEIEQPPAPGMVYAPDIWNRIIASAHKYAEPGIIFIDEVNRHNHMMASMGPIHACNPCGEQMLHFNNSCNLGSIDVAKFYKKVGDGTDADECIDWARLARATHISTQFLDNVVDAGHFPLPEIDDVVKRTRPVGLGIMGFADLCLALKVTYGEQDSIELMEKVMGFVRRESWMASLRLGAEKGVFPEFEANREAYSKFLYEEIGVPRDMPLTPRNYEVTTIAPTGTISLVAETSSGIEPNFSWAYVRRDTLASVITFTLWRRRRWEWKSTKQTKIRSKKRRSSSSRIRINCRRILSARWTFLRTSTSKFWRRRKSTLTTPFPNVQRRERRHGRIGRSALPNGEGFGLQSRQLLPRWLARRSGFDFDEGGRQKSGNAV
jgi:ribonucleoside-diphosphate reductase alpha chain